MCKCYNCASRLEDPKSIDSPIQLHSERNSFLFFICNAANHSFFKKNPPSFLSFPALSIHSIRHDFWQDNWLFEFDRYNVTFFIHFLLRSNQRLPLEPAARTIKFCDRTQVPQSQKRNVDGFPIDYYLTLFSFLFFPFFFWHDDAPFPHDARDVVSISRSCTKRWLAFNWERVKSTISTDLQHTCSGILNQINIIGLLTLAASYTYRKYLMKSWLCPLCPPPN